MGIGNYGFPGKIKGKYSKNFYFNALPKREIPKMEFGITFFIDTSKTKTSRDRVSHECDSLAVSMEREFVT